jgi:hypothetical protein
VKVAVFSGQGEVFSAVHRVMMSSIGFIPLLASDISCYSGAMSGAATIAQNFVSIIGN